MPAFPVDVYNCLPHVGGGLQNISQNYASLKEWNGWLHYLNILLLRCFVLTRTQAFFGNQIVNLVTSNLQNKSLRSYSGTEDKSWDKETGLQKTVMLLFSFSLIESSFENFNHSLFGLLDYYVKKV